MKFRKKPVVVEAVQFTGEQPWPLCPRCPGRGLRRRECLHDQRCVRERGVPGHALDLSVILCADAAKIPLADNSVDLVMGSPPYCDARTYGIGAQRTCDEWVAWMLGVVQECVRVCRGAVIVVAAGVTRDRNYWPACEGLMWEWYRQGGSMYRPCYFHRIGIPGSGGDQWFRADVEYIMCFKRPGKLPWSNNTACGHPPKWAPGGEMSHRLADGARRDQWGGTGGKTANRTVNGERDITMRPSHICGKSRRGNNQMKANGYPPPVLVNPGNVIKLLVGGGHMGSKLAHENEAPYPEKLCERFILSLCPPGGIVLDPFCGSGTTAAVALRHHRKAIASDIRWSQAKSTRRRLSEVQLALPLGTPLTCTNGVEGS